MPATAFISLALLGLVPLSYRCDERAVWLVLPAYLLLFALLETALGAEHDPPQRARSQAIARLPLWLYILAQLSVTAWGMAEAAESESLAGRIGLALATGIAAGIFGMLAAHEMIHRRNRAERLLGLAMLAGVSYLHFRISHLYGHHRRAATSEDPATARKGEGAYRFLLRSIAGQWTEAWRFEQVRSRRGRWPWLANRVYWYTAVSIAIYLAIGAGLGVRAVVFQLTQSAVAILILELFNYVAHYGLERRVLADGRAAPLEAAHSWNATRRFDAWALHNGGYHSHHHRRPSTAYQELCCEPGAPELPLGLGGSILVALVPPLWRRLMNPRVEYWAARPSQRRPDDVQRRQRPHELSASAAPPALRHRRYSQATGRSAGCSPGNTPR